MLRKKFAKANFNFIKRQFIVWIATSSKTNLTSICYVSTNQFLRLLLGEAPAAAGDEGTPRKLCSHLLF